MCCALIFAIIAYAMRSARAVFAVSFVGSTALLGLMLMLGFGALTGAINGIQQPLWNIDSFSGLLLLLIGIVQWGAMLSSIPYLTEELHEELVTVMAIRRYFFCLFMFVLALSGAVMADNLGVMWIMLEGSTLATTLLVAFYPREGSLEAAWKYVVLCSTGLSLGLLGLLILYAAVTNSGSAEGVAAMSASGLLGVAAHLPANLVRIAFVFVLIGYGTKAGLAPMHSWLPDAHSRAPAPISGLLSGVSLNVALFSVIRYKAIVDAALGGSAWTNGLFLAFGAISVAVPAAFVLLQQDYKRLLAYSSIEHMGLTVFAWGLGGIGVAAALIHMIGHALAKSMLFFGAGNILVRFKSTKFARIHDLKRALPITRTLFVFGTFALLAAPPSPLFYSEYLIVLAGIMAHPILVTIVLLSLALIFAGFITHLMPMLFQGATHLEVHRSEPLNLSHVAMSLNFALLMILGCALWTAPGREFIIQIAHYYAV